MKHMQAPTRPRKGVVLLVVLAMLTLFSVVAVAFVYYSENQAGSARNFRDAEVVTNLDPEQVASFLLRQIVYDTADNQSAFRMQGLMTNMYGLQGNTPFSGTGLISGNAPTVNPMSTAQFDIKTLRNHYGNSADPFGSLAAARAYEAVNGSPNAPYTAADHNSAFLALLGGNGVLSARSYARSVRFTIPMTNAGSGQSLNLEIEFNPYEARHRLFWSWYSGSIANVLAGTQSPAGLDSSAPIAASYGDQFFHYDLEITNAAGFGITAAGPQAAWYTLSDLLTDGYTFQGNPPNVGITAGRAFFRFIQADAPILNAMVFRPGPWQHFVPVSAGSTLVRASFPAPADTGGDVKNLGPDTRAYVGPIGGAQAFSNGGDSFWMDLGYPVASLPNGRKYKAMGAVTIIDQDSKVNVNTAGNIQGLRRNPNTGQYENFHTSGVTSYPWDVSIERLLAVAGSGVYNLENTRLHNGANTSAQRRVDGKYGGLPNTAVIAGVAPTDAYADNTYANYTPITPSGKEYSPPFNLSNTFDHDASVTANQFHDTSVSYLLPGSFATWNEYLGASYVDRALHSDRFPRRTPYGVSLPNGTAQTVTSRGWNESNADEKVHYVNVPPLNISRKSPLFHSPITSEFSNGLQSRNRTFGPANIEGLYRYRDISSEKIDSELRPLIPESFQLARARYNLTTNSTGLNRIAASPWWNQTTDNSNTNSLKLATGNRIPLADNAVNFGYNTGITNAPAGNDLPFPDRQSGFIRYTGNEQFPPSAMNVIGQSAPSGDYEMDRNTTNWVDIPTYRRDIAARARSILSQLDRLDINAQLPDYPVPVYGAPGAFGTQAPIDTTDAYTLQAYQQALASRQAFAEAIYFRLILSAGLDTLNLEHTTHGAQIADAARWLGQLAVNMVDYLDGDDYMTHFNWVQSIRNFNQVFYRKNVTLDPVPTAAYSPMGNIVFGTELPKLLVSEVYLEAVNGGGNLSSNMRHWVELYNPLSNSPVRLRTDWGTLMSPQRIQPFRLVIAPSGETDSLSNTNTRGKPINIGETTDAPSSTTQVIALGDDLNRLVLPNGNIAASENAVGLEGYNHGFYLVGPPAGFPTTGGAASRRATPNQQDAQMEVVNRIPSLSNPPNIQNFPQAVLLQRLACPDLPHEPNPILAGVPNPLYNPYITTDQMSELVANDANDLVSQTPPTPNPELRPVTQRFSWAKSQPYVSHPKFNVPSRKTTPSTTEAQHTFYGLNVIDDFIFPDPITNQNFTLASNSWNAGIAIDSMVPSPNERPNFTLPNQTSALPFSWLVHLDRQAISPGELLHLSGYKPHQLTNRFFNAPILNPPPPAQPPRDGFTIQTAAGIAANTDIDLSAAGTVIPQIGSRFLARDGLAYGLQPQSFVFVKRSNTEAFWTKITTVTGPNGTIIQLPVAVQMNDELVIPHFFAHYAPWMNSNSRIFRFLETVATRNPGVEMSQFIFGVTQGQVRAGPAPGGYGVDGSVPLGIYRLRVPNLCRLLPTLTPNDGLLDIKVGDIITGNANMRVTAVNKEDDLVNGSYIEVASPIVPAVPGNYALHYHTGRQPGLININTVTDDAVLEAMIDPQRSNAFIQSHVTDSILKRATSVIGRSRTIGMNGPTSGLLGATSDRPFSSLATGPTIPSSPGLLNANGLDDTLLRNDPTDNTTTKLLFEMGRPGAPVVPPTPPNPHTTLANSSDPAAHPYLRYQMLTKMWNNVSSRSNVFIIWMTIGFFEVDEATGRLGAEIGQLEGVAKRHRFMFVVDRSILDRYIRMNQVQMADGSPANVYDVRRGIGAVNNIDLPYANKPLVNLEGFLAKPGVDPRFESDVYPMRVGRVVQTNIGGVANLAEVEVISPVADTTGIAPGLPIIFDKTTATAELSYVVNPIANGLPNLPNSWATGPGRFYVFFATPKANGTQVTISLPSIPKVVLHSAVLQ